jgi:hypothetical protein
VRAHFIFEKFTDESDPIHDLGIGIYSPHTFKTNKDLYEFLYNIMPSMFHVERPIDLVSKHAKLYFTGNTLIELRKYINTYVTMYSESQWWSFDVPAFHTYLIHRHIKENKKKENESKIY